VEIRAGSFLGKGGEQVQHERIPNGPEHSEALKNEGASCVWLLSGREYSALPRGATTKGRMMRSPTAHLSILALTSRHLSC
jgi:hypothetical protein